MDCICTVPWGLHLILVTCRAPDCALFDQQCQGPLAYSGGVVIRLGFYIGILALPLGGAGGHGGNGHLAVYGLALTTAVSNCAVRISEALVLGSRAEYIQAFIATFRAHGERHGV